MSEEKNEAKIFLTDYGSYNEGRQFEFGHWVDLNQFDSYEELRAYIAKHFKECDQKSPLYGSPREEIMITDFEGFPIDLYSETGNLEQIMEYLNMVEENSYGRDVFEAYLSENDLPDTIERLEEMVEMSYQGEFDSDADFAEHYFESFCEINETIRNFIDWKLASRDLFFTSNNGHYFMSE